MNWEEFFIRLQKLKDDLKKKKDVSADCIELTKFIFREYGDILASIFYRGVQNREISADLLQDMCIIVRNSLHQARATEKARFLAWLSVIARRLVYAAWKEKKRKKEVTSLDDSPIDFPSSEESVYLQIVRKEELELLHKAIKKAKQTKLNDLEKKVLDLFLKGLSHSEIVDKLEKKPSHIRVTLLRVKHKLKDILDKWGLLDEEPLDEKESSDDEDLSQGENNV